MQRLTEFSQSKDPDNFHLGHPHLLPRLLQRITSLLFFTASPSVSASLKTLCLLWVLL